VSQWAPYGHRFASDGSLAPEPVEQAALAAIAALRDTGLSLAVSRELAARGILARGGQPLAAKMIASDRLPTGRLVTAEGRHRRPRLAGLASLAAPAR
jgi:hypothetical protein